ncbi:DUF4253 domain-containing protein [Streptomyces sp. NPDC014983]|uniref:DUF4253 domain-containing protein n=1 Tax=Streptomyces sp. NPDC014983 TaxID=3364933 RepID=UPI0036FDF430
MWLSAAPVSDPVASWTHCQSAREETGLWPLLVSAPYGPGRPTALAAVDALDLHDVLERDWHSYRASQLRRLAAPREPEDLPEDVEPWDEDPGAPFDRWPGLAAGITALAGADPDAAARAAVSRLMTGPYPLPKPHLALVPATRSADVPAVMGWHAEAPLPLLCALLRSWEDRFGARVVAFDGAMIHVSVARPPRDADHAAHVALEHVLTGADNVNDGTVPYPDHAASLVGSPLWSFWWD